MTSTTISAIDLPFPSDDDDSDMYADYCLINNGPNAFDLHLMMIHTGMLTPEAVKEVLVTRPLVAQEINGKHKTTIERTSSPSISQTPSTRAKSDFRVSPLRGNI